MSDIFSKHTLLPFLSDLGRMLLHSQGRRLTLENTPGRPWFAAISQFIAHNRDVGGWKLLDADATT
jgi:hypothetical protein